MSILNVPEGPKPIWPIALFFGGMILSLVYRVSVITAVAWIVIGTYWGWYFGMYYGRYIVFTACIEKTERILSARPTTESVGEEK